MAYGATRLADMAAYNPLCTETLRVHMLYCNGSVSCGMTLCLKSVRLSAQGVVHREAGRPCMKAVSAITVGLYGMLAAKKDWQAFERKGRACAQGLTVKGCRLKHSRPVVQTTFVLLWQFVALCTEEVRAVVAAFDLRTGDVRAVVAAHGLVRRGYGRSDVQCMAFCTKAAGALVLWLSVLAHKAKQE
eukprot:1160042-Pelagomonas_calceolata.AAC.6